MTRGLGFKGSRSSSKALGGGPGCPPVSPSCLTLLSHPPVSPSCLTRVPRSLLCGLKTTTYSSCFILVFHFPNITDVIHFAKQSNQLNDVGIPKSKTARIWFLLKYYLGIRTTQIIDYSVSVSVCIVLVSLAC